MRMVQLGEFIPVRGKNITPSRFPDEQFELFSIPAHDRGQSEIALGSDVGSSKQLVEPGDVLISKIIPHIRRVQIVPASSGLRQIASGEWIVIRTQEFDARYLRHLLLSDRFHAQFMNTVAGVGGSLVRARPEFVKQIRVAIPALDDQRRIAAILDQADAIRTKRRQIISRLELAPAAYLESALRESEFELHALADVAEVWDCSHSTPAWTKSGRICIRTSNLGHGVWSWEDTRYISDQDFARRQKGGGSLPGDIILSREGTVGVGAMIEAGMSVAMGQRLVQVRAKHIDPYFLMWYLLYALDPSRISHMMVGATSKHLNVRDLRSLPVPTPDLAKQERFATFAVKIAQARSQALRAATRANELFASLQARAFKGEL